MFKSGLVLKKVLSTAIALVLTLQVFSTRNYVKAEGDEFPDKQVFAEKTELLSSWGDVSFNEGRVMLNNGSDQKIVFGKDPKTGQPISWWIASRVFSNGESSPVPSLSSHMVIYSVHSLLSDPFNENGTSENISYSSLKEKLREEIKYTTENSGQVYQNHYGVSDIRHSLKSLLSGNERFSSGEKKLIKESPIMTNDVKNKTIYFTNENLYLPSGNLSFGMMSWGNVDISSVTEFGNINPKNIIPFDYLVKKTENDDRLMWLRSPDSAKSNCALIALPFREANIQSQRVSYSFESMPVCKINVEELLFASAASSVFADSQSTLNGKFAPVDKNSPNYGMHLKFRPTGTELTDSLVEVRNGQPSVVNYYNAPKDSCITVCAIEKNDVSKSYYTSMRVNESGNVPNGFVDLSKLNSECVGNGKDLQVKVWVERKEKSGIVVASPAVSTEFKTTDKRFTIGDIPAVVYSGEKVNLSNLVVKFGETTLNQATDYDVEYFSNKNVGEALVVVKGKGEYLGYIESKTFEIMKATPNIVLQDKSVAFDGEYKAIDAVSVMGVDGKPINKAKVKYIYYMDAQCTKKLCIYSPSSKSSKIPDKMPKNLGIYFVKAVFGENDEYCSAESNVAKLTISESA